MICCGDGTLNKSPITRNNKAMSEQTILASVDGRGVATITLNRARVHNAMNGAMLAELEDAISGFEADPDIRILLLRAGGKNFSAGADMKPQDDAVDAQPAPSLPAAIQALERFTRPTLALVQGACIGGGVAWITACDIVVASEDAFFSIPEVRLGFNPASLIPMFLGAIGPRNTMRYVLGGDRFDAAKAQEMGLVHHLCPVGALDEAAAPIIDALLSGGPEAIVATKAPIIELAGLMADAELAARLDAMGEASRASDEAAEGRASFVEMRPPNWKPPE